MIDVPGLHEAINNDVNSSAEFSAGTPVMGTPRPATQPSARLDAPDDVYFATIEAP